MCEEYRNTESLWSRNKEQTPKGLFAVYSLSFSRLLRHAVAGKQAGIITFRHACTMLALRTNACHPLG